MYDDIDDVVERGNAICREVRYYYSRLGLQILGQSEINSAWRVLGVKRSEKPGALARAIYSLILRNND